MGRKGTATAVGLVVVLLLAGLLGVFFVLDPFSTPERRGGPLAHTPESVDDWQAPEQADPQEDVRSDAEPAPDEPSSPDPVEADAPDVAVDVEPEPVAPVEPRVVAFGDSSVEGRVVTLDGHAPEGVTVRLVEAYGDEDQTGFPGGATAEEAATEPAVVTVATAPLGSGGSFSFDRVPPGSYQVQIDAPVAYTHGRTDAFQLVPTEHHDVGELVLTRAGRMLGIVLDPDRNPVEGATVTITTGDQSTSRDLWSSSGVVEIESATTGPDGRFVIERILPGSFKARAHFPGFGVGESETVEIVASASGEVEAEIQVEVTVTLPEATVLHVLVHNSAQVPIAGAQVRFDPVDSWAWTGGALPRLTLDEVLATTDGRGRATVPGPIRQGRLYATAPGYAESMGWVWDQQTQGVTEEAPITLTIHPGTIVVGTIVDAATGRAFPSSEVAMSVALAQTARQGRGQSLEGEIKEGGQFVVQDVPPGTYRLTVEREGYMANSQQVEVSQGIPTTNAGNVRLEAAGSIDVVVRNDAGEPVAGAKVWVRYRVNRGQGVERTDADRLTDLEGRASLGVVPYTDVAVYASADGYVETRVGDVEVPAGGGTVVVQVELVRAGVVLVLVQDEQGEPIRQAWVSLQRTGGDSTSGGGRGGWNGLQGRSDMSGVCRFDSIEPGTYRVTAASTTHDQPDDPVVEITAVLGQDTEVRVTMIAEKMLRGRVVDTGGAAVAGARVELVRIRRGRAADETTTTDADGRFEIDSSSTARGSVLRITLSSSQASGSDSGVPPLMYSLGTLDLDRELLIEVDTAPVLGSVSVVAQFTGGRSGGVRVSLGRAGFGTQYSQTLGGQAGGAAVLFEDVPQGRFELTVRAGGWVTHTEVVEVIGRSTVSVPVTLAQAASVVIELEFEGAAEGSQTWARVRAYEIVGGGQRLQRSQTWMGAGQSILGGLVPGVAYTIVIESTQGTYVTQEIRAVAAMGGTPPIAVRLTRQG